MSLVDSIDGARAVVVVDVTSACPRCAAGKGCGAGLFAGGGADRQVEATIPPGMDIAVQDVVEISLAPDNLLRAAIIVYGLPMIGAVIGAVIAYALSFGDVVAALAALTGLGSGLVLSRWRLQQTDCLQRFVPSIERRLK